MEIIATITVIDKMYDCDVQVKVTAYLPNHDEPRIKFTEIVSDFCCCDANAWLKDNAERIEEIFLDRLAAGSLKLA